MSQLSHFNPLVRLTFCAAALVLTLSMADADVKTVSHLHSEEGGATRPDVTITTYYKGPIIRTESGGLVTLLNTTTGKSAILHPDTKTFSVFNIDQVAQTGMTPGGTVEAHATVTQTEEHKVIAGKKATKFVADVDMILAPTKLLSRHLTMHIVRWTTSDVKMAVAPDVLEKFSPEQLTFKGLKGMEDVQKELAKITGLPLSSEVTINSEYSAPQGVGGVPPASTQTIDIDVDSISDEDLDDSLFQIPTDYKNRGAVQSHLPGPGAGGG